MAELDPTTRAQIEILADHWREVYPAGQDYWFRILEELAALESVGEVTQYHNSLLTVAVAKYANGEADRIEWPDVDAVAGTTSSGA